MNMKLLTGLALWFLVSIGHADSTLKPFNTDSLKTITDSRPEIPFLMILWSVDCPPCIKELSQLQQLRDQFSTKSLVLVSTDDAYMADEVARVLSSFQLDQKDNWIFAASLPERLRYAIDPGWYGELPRAYFYQPPEQRRAHSGSLNQSVLQQWLEQTRQQPPLKTTLAF